MMKYILVLAISISLLNTAKCQKKDTTITYRKYGAIGDYKVMTRDSADFIRIVLPSDDINEDLTVNEFYKNGHIKLIGKFDHVYYNNKRNSYEQLVGDCITYFPNGKKKATMTYNEGSKVGDEYLFYPTGTIYSYIKHVWSGRRLEAPKVLNWECYDDKGNKTCADGNGRWLLFNDSFQLTLSGNVKNGQYDGEWKGATLKADSIKYTYNFKDGVLISGIGYDRTGKAYPFARDAQAPIYKVKASYYNVEPNVFVRQVRNNTEIPNDAKGKKASLDTAHVAFIVERDGSLTNIQLLGNTNPELAEAVKKAVEKIGGWSPRTYYGIPVRSRITLPYKEVNGMVEIRELIVGYDFEKGYIY